MNTTINESTPCLIWQPFHEISWQGATGLFGIVEGMKDCLNSTMMMRQNFEGLIIGCAEHLEIVEGLVNSSH
jgi:hypothetical protein